MTANLLRDAWRWRKHARASNNNNNNDYSSTLTHSKTELSFWSPQIRISAMDLRVSTNRLRFPSVTVWFLCSTEYRYLEGKEKHNVVDLPTDTRHNLPRCSPLLSRLKIYTDPEKGWPLFFLQTNGLNVHVIQGERYVFPNLPLTPKQRLRFSTWTPC